MKHFIVNLNYIVSIDIIDKYLGEHRNFLDTGYKNNFLLASGPKEPREGGIIIARADSKKEIEDYFSKDPFYIHNCATYTYVEFNPVKSQSIFRNWFIT